MPMATLLTAATVPPDVAALLLPRCFSFSSLFHRRYVSNAAPYTPNVTYTRAYDNTFIALNMTSMFQLPLSSGLGAVDASAVDDDYAAANPPIVASGDDDDYTPLGKAAPTKVVAAQ